MLGVLGIVPLEMGVVVGCNGCVGVRFSLLGFGVLGEKNLGA